MSPSPHTTRGDWIALVVLLIGTFMASLDVTIVNVAAPHMQEDLGLSGAGLQLVISGYSVVYATLLITMARLGDDHGHRRLFLFGLATFTGASLLCGLAWSEEVLIGARVLQAAGAAAMSPQVVTVIQLRFADAARAKALALFAIVISFGAVAGQVLGGALVTVDLLGTSWRPVFLVNVPVGVALLAAGPRLLPVTRGARRGLDLGGVALLSAVVLLVIVPLVFGHEADWAPWTFACLAASVPAGALLVAHLARRRTAGGDPLVDLRLLRRPPLTLAVLSVCAVVVAYGGFLFTMTLHLQGGLGRSALSSGLTFAPYALGFAVVSLLMAGVGPGRARVLTPLGLAITALAYLGLGLAARQGAWDAAIQLPLLAVAGAGFGTGFSPLIARAVSDVPAAAAPDASGLVNTAVQLCFALGVATIGSVFLDEATAMTAAVTGHAFAIAAYACGALALAGAGLAVALGRAERAPVPAGAQGALARSA
jgi:EmrB/QacA subfamily drug resistance transporter